MIELYSGTPGSGKSYHATERAYYALRSGKNVIANFSLDLPVKPKIKGVFSFWSNSEITVGNLIDYADMYHDRFKEHQTIIILDEAGIKFNSRKWQDADRMRWLDFFSQHRKLGFDVILIAQSDQMLDKQIREFVEVEHNHRLMRSAGLTGGILSIFFTFVDVRSYYANKMRLGCDFVRLNKRIASMYDSFATFDNSSNGGVYD